MNNFEKPALRFKFPHRKPSTATPNARFECYQLKVKIQIMSQAEKCVQQNSLNRTTGNTSYVPSTSHLLKFHFITFLEHSSPPVHCFSYHIISNFTTIH